MKTVVIGRRKVPVSAGSAAAEFSAGRRGAHEKGVYLFWTAVCLEDGAERVVFGRALKTLDAGERFRRIEKEMRKGSSEKRAMERALWKRLRGALYVRPSWNMEVVHWLVTHPEDAKYLKSLRFTAK